MNATTPAVDTQATSRQRIIEGGTLPLDPRVKVRVGMQFKVKHVRASHDWSGLWTVADVERRTRHHTPKVVVIRAGDPPTHHTVLLDEQIQLSKRRTLVVEDMILGGCHHLAQSIADPHRNRGRRDGRAVESLAAQQPVALLVKPRQNPNELDPDDDGFVVKNYDDYDGVADLAHGREDEPLQFDLHECVADAMCVAQCSRCDGLGCEQCCGDGELDTCGTCEGPGCLDCSFTGKRRGQTQAASLSAEESQALYSAQDSFVHAKSRNPSYQLWMGSVTNSLCGICLQPAGISSYPAKCKHLFHRHCLEACQSALQCEFCGRSVTVAFDQPSELWRAADPQQALRDAICACSTKHDRKAPEKKREHTHHRDDRHTKREKRADGTS
jgi:hypothetical protein